jgi:uncharacterized protein (TIGR00369 family)
MKKYESRNPNYRAYVEFKISKNKFISWLGMVITKIEPGYIEAELDFKEMHQQQNGWLHGGVTSAILDMVEGFAAYSLVPEGTQVFTADAHISYYNPGIATKFYARGWVDKPGKAFHFCLGELYYVNEQNEEVIVAKGSTTMAVK